ncbi:type II toxin-antitoxin system RelE/ParE family toxin [Enterococcus olivae]
MKYNVKLTNDLLEDLSQLSSYLTSEFSEAVSQNVLASLFDTFDSLGEFPYKGKDAATLMFTFSGYRYLPLKQNVMFYAIDEGNQTVNLLRLYSVSEDPMQKFKRYLE